MLGWDKLASRKIALKLAPKFGLFFSCIAVLITGCQAEKLNESIPSINSTPRAEEIDTYLTKQAEATPLPTMTRDLELEKQQTEVAQNPDWVHMVATDPMSFKMVSGKYQLVEKMAFWCAECRNLNPILKSLESVWGDKINFIYLDVDDPLNTENLDKLSRLRVVPEVVLLDGSGKVIKDWIGPPTKEELAAAFQNLP
jgi:thiol-disulfide isomerase/thioredoxin